MQNNPVQFALKAKELGLRAWGFPCSRCSRVVGFEFDFETNSEGNVRYNQKCACKFNDKYRCFESNWQAVADRYFLEDRPEVKADFDALWGFSGREIS